MAGGFDTDLHGRTRDSSLLRALPSAQEILLRPRNPRCRLMAPLPLDLEQYPSRGLSHPLPCPTGHFHLTLLAHYRRCPATVFLASSMFPLIPGMSFYRAVLFLLIGNSDLGLSFLRACFLASFTIAIAVSLTQQIPSRYFVLGKKLKTRIPIAFVR